jgi:hypothetical protein
VRASQSIPSERLELRIHLGHELVERFLPVLAHGQSTP